MKFAAQPSSSKIHKASKSGQNDTTYVARTFQTKNECKWAGDEYNGACGFREALSSYQDVGQNVRQTEYSKLSQEPINVSKSGYLDFYTIKLVRHQTHRTTSVTMDVTSFLSIAAGIYSERRDGGSTHSRAPKEALARPTERPSLRFERRA